MKKFYAVVIGKSGPNVYSTWDECHQNVSGYPGAIYKSFKTIQEANLFIKSKISSSNSASGSSNSASGSGSNSGSVSVSGSGSGSSSSSGRSPIKKSELNHLHLKKISETLTLNDLEKQSIAKIVVFTDGSCRDQGTSIAKAGAGIYFTDLDLRFAISVPGKQTNNRGEMFAVIKALQLIEAVKTDLKKDHLIKDLPIEIHLDSRYVMDNFNSNNRENLDFWQELIRLCSILQVKFVKVPAHTGIIGNEIADQLAKKIAFSKL